MTNLNSKLAVAQFGRADDPVLKELAASATADGAHWYLFDETADAKFELEDLCNHYDLVFLCVDAHNIVEVKYDKKNI